MSNILFNVYRNCFIRSSHFGVRPSYADQLKEIIRAYAGVRAMYKAETSSLEANIIKLHC